MKKTGAVQSWKVEMNLVQCSGTDIFLPPGKNEIKCKVYLTYWEYGI